MTREITLLDGGMGQELVARSGDRPTPLWATQVMMDHPGLVRAVHADYFAAALCLRTASSSDRASCVLLTGDQEFKRVEDEITITWL